MYYKLFCLLISLSSTLIASAQNTRYIRFRDEDPGQRMSHYYITAIKDDRADTSRIGELKMGLLGKKETVINLEAGATTAIGRYIQQNFRQDTTASPVELHITELRVKEQPGGIRAKVETIMVLTFYAGGTRLTDYKGRGEVQTMGDLLKHTEDLLRQNIRNSLLEFDDWWGKNKQVYSTDAPVSLTVTVEHTPKDSNLIGYAPARPLSPDDFNGSPDGLSRAAASTASAVSVRYATDVNNGRVKVQVIITPFFDPNKSWFREKLQSNTQILGHEQGHFDITGLIACELADTLRQQQLTKKDYLEKLEAIHARKQTELGELQKRYDAETRHGQQQATQERWTKWIRERLAARSCYPVKSETVFSGRHRGNQASRQRRKTSF